MGFHGTLGIISLGRRWLACDRNDQPLEKIDRVLQQMRVAQAQLLDLGNAIFDILTQPFDFLCGRARQFRFQVANTGLFIPGHMRCPHRRLAMLFEVLGNRLPQRFAILLYLLDRRLQVPLFLQQCIHGFFVGIAEYITDRAADLNEVSQRFRFAVQVPDATLTQTLQLLLGGAVR